MRVYISGDIEGCTGIVSWSQCDGPDSDKADWAFARRMYTHDINAAIRGALSGGATEIVVKDSHGTCRNLLVDELEPGVELITGYGAAEHGMMEGIRAGFDACFLVGYHSMGGTQGGIMEHALAGGLHRFWINGIEGGEILASAALAGAYGCPLVLVTSDEDGCNEASALVAGVGITAVKLGIGRFMGKMLHPSITGPLISKAAEQAVMAARSITPYVIVGPATFKVQFRDTAYADLPQHMKGVRRPDGYTLEWTCPSLLEAHSMMYQVFGVASTGQRGGAG